jgi:UDP-N-acetylmuramate--alanine ligase
LHFVGIGGAGMSGLALVARALDAQVTGSDQATSVYTESLRERGISVTLGHAAENVPAEAEVVYSTAVPPSNPERQAAAGRELHRSELLAQIATLRRCLAITGTHGKTTTAAMVVHALRGCGLDPSYVIGGELRETGCNADWGGGEWIVVEADESDRSLLNLEPEVAVLTNAELDHHSTYSSQLDLEATLREFMARARRPAVVWDRPSLVALCPPGAIPYDAPDPVLEPGGSRFIWRGHDVVLSLPGAHNAINAAVAVFQPHLYSRTAALAGQFGAALAGADICAVLDVYPARERAADFPGVDGRLVAGAAAEQAGGRQVAWLPDFADARAFLQQTLRSGDLCLVMGAGNIDALGRSLVDQA